MFKVFYNDVAKFCFHFLVLFANIDVTVRLLNITDIRMTQYRHASHIVPYNWTRQRKTMEDSTAYIGTISNEDILLWLRLWTGK